MRNVFLLTGLILLFAVKSVIAQEAQNPTEAPVTSMDIAYGDIAALSQKIALSQRKIEAAKLQTSLEKLQEEQMTGNFPFKILRIEGFNESLYAILTDDKGVIYQVGPGEVFADHYRITLIRPSAVGVLDTESHRAYVVPFLLTGPAAMVAYETANTNKTS